MKKIIGSLIACACLYGASASAAEIKNPFTGGTTDKSIYVGIDRVDFRDEGVTMSTNGLNIGGEVTHTYDSNIFVGLGGDVSYAHPNLGANGDTSVYTLGVHTKLGYAIEKEFALYGILGGNMQKIQYDVDPTLGFGYVYGLGAEFKFAKNFAADVELKRGWIEADGDVRDLHYEYKTTGVKLKYIF